MTLEDFCAQNNIQIQYYPFTTKIRGMCMKYDDGFIIAINPRFCDSTMKNTFIHEMIHIMHDHLYCEKDDFEKCEKEVENSIKTMKNQFDLNHMP